MTGSVESTEPSGAVALPPHPHQVGPEHCGLHVTWRDGPAHSDSVQTGLEEAASGVVRQRLPFLLSQCCCETPAACLHSRRGAKVPPTPSPEPTADD